MVVSFGTSPVIADGKILVDKGVENYDTSNEDNNDKYLYKLKKSNMQDDYRFHISLQEF